MLPKSIWWCYPAGSAHKKNVIITRYYAVYDERKVFVNERDRITGSASSFFPRLESSKSGGPNTDENIGKIDIVQRTLPSIGYGFPKSDEAGSATPRYPSIFLVLIICFFLSSPNTVMSLEKWSGDTRLCFCYPIRLSETFISAFSLLYHSSSKILESFLALESCILNDA